MTHIATARSRPECQRIALALAAWLARAYYAWWQCGSLGSKYLILLSLSQNATTWQRGQRATGNVVTVAASLPERRRRTCTPARAREAYA